MLKALVRKFDSAFLGNALQKSAYNWKIARKLTPFTGDGVYRVEVFHDKDRHQLLSSLFDKYGSDKGSLTSGEHPYRWPPHTYADYYSTLFLHTRHHVRNVFECGLGTNNPDLVSSMGNLGRPGASLRAWRDFFPNAQVFGADIDKEVLFEEERIKTLYMDQLDPKAITAYWEQIGPIEFDFMLDDGLHTFDGGRILFENSISQLADEGVYIIEDVTLDDLAQFKAYFTEKPYVVQYVVMHRPNMGLNDNTMIVIRRQ